MTMEPTPCVEERWTDIPPDKWLFGQYNKLLPVKAACRALWNLLRSRPAGIALTEAASRISDAARGLGDYLQVMDALYQPRREGSLSAAFPTSSIDSDGSRLRFANQFVAQSRQDRLEGLPAGLKLVTLDPAKPPRLWLTKAGADFALLDNPVLDAKDPPPDRKFSDPETRFLLSHILQSVPREVSAYTAIMDAVEGGSNGPEEVDAFLRERFGLKMESDISRTFLATQRTGAISRMIDLGLLVRIRKGLNVRYHATTAGLRFRAGVNAGKSSERTE